jgi:hypothetical protein
VRLEFGGLFSFADDRADLESSFERQNQSLEADVARDTGDL